MQLRSILVLSAIWLAAAGCSKSDNETPYSEAETSSGYEQGPLEKTGEELDQATDEATDEVEHMDNDRDEKVDEATDAVDEAAGVE